MNDSDDTFIFPDDLLDEWEFETEDLELDDDLRILTDLEDELHSETD